MLSAFVANTAGFSQSVQPLWVKDCNYASVRGLSNALGALSASLCKDKITTVRKGFSFRLASSFVSHSFKFAAVSQFRSLKSGRQQQGFILVGF